ncbi:MAG TPA: MFS transporter [Solirubrobacteraceae bacterium]|nr:MFS transporter [Solirubrobacteraceae bacterium]
MRSRAWSSVPFRLLLVGQGVSSIGDGVAPVALSFAVLDLTGSVRDLGLILAARSLPLIAFVLLGGVLADRFPRKAMMLASEAVRAAVQGASAALLLTGTAHVWELAVLQAIYGAGQAFFGPASTGILPEMVGAEDLQDANGLMGVSENLSSVVGPALGGVLVVAAGAGWGLAFDAAAFLVSAVSLQLMRLPDLTRPERRSAVTEMREGWRAFRSRRWLWTSVAALPLILVVVFAPLDVLGPAVARARLGGAGAWAAISVATGVGAVLGGVAGMRWRPRYPLRTGFLLTILGEPALLFLLARGELLALIVAFALVSGLASTVFNVLWFTALQREIPAEEISRVSSWDHFGSYALQPIGLAIVGPIAIAIGVSATLYAAAGLAVLLTLAVLSVGAVRDFQLSPAPAAEAAPADSSLP